MKAYQENRAVANFALGVSTVLLESPWPSVLVEGPEKNVLILENKLISNKESELIDSGLPHFDYLG